jgi:hypothetical protein
MYFSKTSFKRGVLKNSLNNGSTLKKNINFQGAYIVTCLNIIVEMCFFKNQLHYLVVILSTDLNYLPMRGIGICSFNI